MCTRRAHTSLLCVLQPPHVYARYLVGILSYEQPHEPCHLRRSILQAPLILRFLDSPRKMPCSHRSLSRRHHLCPSYQPRAPICSLASHTRLPRGPRSASYLPV
ncbi:hypothetical protein OF83DRAFT_1141417 [Amylostereum chailletii]|nr:hypothetical protein OF83DRAFT_1141417 [Amylostereum chailletii]